MRCFLFRLLCYVALMAAVCGGAIMLLHLAERKAGGATGRTLYINDSLMADILVLGSSRALHHYDPTIMQPVLQHDVYNCGEDKMGIIFNYGRYCIVSRRYAPKVIVYDIEPDYDLLYDDNTSYISGLRQYQDLDEIRNLLVDVDSSERIKTLLWLYQLNNRLLPTIKDIVSPTDNFKLGYLPYDGIMEVFLPEKLPQDHYDSLKRKYLEKLVDHCQGRTQIVFTASPQLSYRSDSVYVPLKKYCAERGIPFLNHFCDTAFTNHPQLFHDANHLERRGAERFSAMISKEIKRCLK